MESIKVIFVFLFCVLMVGCQSPQTDVSDVLDQNIDLSSDLMLAQRHFEDADYGMAEKLFRKEVEKSPNSVNALMGLAASYDQLRRFDLSERIYQRLFKIAGRSPQIVSNYGFSHYLRGDKNEALKLFKEAEKKLPQNIKVKSNKDLVS
jgi:Flp pilus assembly protein TadD